MAVRVEGAVLGGHRLQVLVLLHLHLEEVPAFGLELLDSRRVRGGLLGRELAAGDGVLLRGFLLERDDVLIEALQPFLRAAELALELLVVERRVPAARVKAVVFHVEHLGAAPDGGPRRRRVGLGVRVTGVRVTGVRVRVRRSSHRDDPGGASRRRSPRSKGQQQTIRPAPQSSMDPSSTRPLEAPTCAYMPSRLASRRRDPRSTACASGVPPGRAFLGYHRRPFLCAASADSDGLGRCPRKIQKR